MDRQYLESFTNEQLEHYLSTLKKRIKDQRELMVQLGSENHKLTSIYDSLVRQRTELHHRNQKKKNSWGSWFNKGAEKLGSWMSISKKQQERDCNHDLNEEHRYHNVNEPRYPSNYDNYNREQRYQDYPNQGGQGYEGKMMSPVRVGKEMYQQGREKLGNLFGRGESRQQGNNYTVQYEKPRRQIFNEIQGDLDKMRKKQSQKKRYDAFLQRTQDPVLHQNQRYEPREVVYVREVQEEADINVRKVVSEVKNQNEIPLSIIVDEKKVEKQGQKELSGRKEKQQEKPVQKEISKQLSKSEQQNMKVQNEIKAEISFNDVEKTSAQKQTQQQIKKSEEVPSQLPNQDQNQNISQNEYEIKYEQPIKDYQLQQTTVNQIIEKSLPSQDQFQQPEQLEAPCEQNCDPDDKSL